jgi:hypothetical protein
MTGYTDPIEPSEQEEAERLKSAKRVQREIDDLKWTMADPRGRRLIARLLERTGTMRSSFHTSGSVMAFNEGRRDIGLFLTAECLEHTPKEYARLMNEYRNDD